MVSLLQFLLTISSPFSLLLLFLILVFHLSYCSFFHLSFSFFFLVDFFLIFHAPLSSLSCYSFSCLSFSSLISHLLLYLIFHFHFFSIVFCFPFPSLSCCSFSCLSFSYLFSLVIVISCLSFAPFFLMGVSISNVGHGDGCIYLFCQLSLSSKLKTFLLLVMAIGVPFLS